MVPPGKYPFQDIFLVLRWFAHAAQRGLRPGAAAPARGGTGVSVADHAGVAMAFIVRMSSSVGKVNKKIAVQ